MHPAASQYHCLPVGDCIHRFTFPKESQDHLESPLAHGWVVSGRFHGQRLRKKSWGKETPFKPLGTCPFTTPQGCCSEKKAVSTTSMGGHPRSFISIFAVATGFIARDSRKQQFSFEAAALKCKIPPPSQEG